MNKIGGLIRRTRKLLSGFLGGIIQKIKQQLNYPLRLLKTALTRQNSISHEQEENKEEQTSKKDRS